MRIGLDYYRILGLPMQATSEQLQQAYRDRTLQLPRREYSEQAIAMRKQLIKTAYTVLSEPEQRSVYDASLLANTETKEITPSQVEQAGPAIGMNGRTNSTSVKLQNDKLNSSNTIDIPNELFIGALLILGELGEYEVVLKLSRTYLSSQNRAIEEGRFGSPQIIRNDIVLTNALACLELGREQWQQGQYEKAAKTLETGQNLLLKEGVFSTIKGEIQLDLYKLRPYRILELLSSSDEKKLERRQGILLLQEMLNDRGGIDGTQDDQSGLTIDDFLRFIQQLRTYLTGEEQQTIFETESQRPSAVATYLAVYALVARGFAEKQPILIQQARQMLKSLAKKQDVYLEQAVCDLLLGQTEDANQALSLSTEQEQLDFIRQHSQGSPDLLPGLCLYGEHWLQTEVFPHFRDLAKKRVALKEYFSATEVQSYLEKISIEEKSESQSEWEVAQIQPVKVGLSITAPSEPQKIKNPIGWGSRHQENGSTSSITQTNHLALANVTPNYSFPPNPSPSVHPSFGTNSTTSQKISSRLKNRRGNRQKSRTETSSNSSNLESKSKIQTLAPRKIRGDRSSKRGHNQFWRLLMIGALGAIGTGAFTFGAIATYQFLYKSNPSSSTPNDSDLELQLQVDQPIVPIPKPTPAPTLAQSPILTKDIAQNIIKGWLSSKTQALGKDYKIDLLKQYLVNPALSRWEERVKVVKANNEYWEYQHQVSIESVDQITPTATEATVKAQVREIAKLYQGDQLISSKSYDENLQVEYNLIRQENKWLIKDMRVGN